MSHAYLPYLKTLRRLPDEVVLDMGTREFQMENPSNCVCGWAIRCGLSMLNGKAPEEFERRDWKGQTAPTCAERYGGTWEEWLDIFCGVACDETLPDIELAFTYRLAEAARGSLAVGAHPRGHGCLTEQAKAEG